MKSFRCVLTATVAAVFGLFAFDATAALSAKSYVLDGLLIHWDGIENVAYGSAHDSTATTWTDLTGSGLALTKPEDFSWAANGLVSVRAVQATTQYNHAQVLRVYNAINAQSYSCEVAYNKPNVTPNGTVGYNTPVVALFGFYYSASYWFGLDGETKAGFNANGVKGSEKALVSATSVTVADTKGSHVLSCVQDVTNVVTRFDATTEKTAVATKATSDLLTRSTKSVMLNQTYANYDFGLEGTYHAIRFYDRPLSADEVKVNTALDQVRFFGADASTITLPDGWRFSDASGELNLERRYAATVSAPGCGTVSVNDGEAGESVDLWLVHNEETAVKLTAVPADGWVFVCWHGLASEDDANKAEVTASIAGNDVTAVFRKLDQLSARCYVSEGLIGHWDGVENVAYGQAHDNAAVKWHELTGNSPNFKLPAGSAFNADSLAVIRANGSLSDDHGVKIITAFNAQSFTCEIAYQKTKETPDSTDGYKKPNAEMLGFDYVGEYWFGNEGDMSVGFSPNDGEGRGPGFVRDCGLTVPTTMGQHSFSCVQDGANTAIRADAALSKESVLIKTGKSTLSTSKTLSLNRIYYDDTGLDGCYYAIRFYDRPLSADEVAVNVAIDQVRFFGKDPEACALPEDYRFNAAKGYPLERKSVVASNDGEMGLVSVDGGEPAAAVDAWVDQTTRQVTLTAVPAKGYKFKRWTGAIAGGDLKSATGTFTVTGDVTAEFKEITGLLLMVR